jgi:hypothetical protein
MRRLSAEHASQDGSAPVVGYSSRRVNVEKSRGWGGWVDCLLQPDTTPREARRGRSLGLPRQCHASAAGLWLAIIVTCFVAGSGQFYPPPNVLPPNPITGSALPHQRALPSLLRLGFLIAPSLASLGASLASLGRETVMRGLYALIHYTIEKYMDGDPALMVQRIACPGDRPLEGLFPPDAFAEDASVNANLYVPTKRHAPQNDTLPTKRHFPPPPPPRPYLAASPPLTAPADRQHRPTRFRAACSRAVPLRSNGPATGSVSMLIEGSMMGYSDRCEIIGREFQFKTSM